MQVQIIYGYIYTTFIRKSESSDKPDLNTRFEGRLIPGSAGLRHYKSGYRFSGLGKPWLQSLCGPPMRMNIQDSSNSGDN